jgi:DNA polymerase-3 subunit epsilon
MSLLEQKFLFLDCQTTGMRPPTGALLELGWGVASAVDIGTVESRIVKLPEGQWLPSKVKEITGIKESMLAAGVAEEELLVLLDGACGPVPEAPALVHYAQFERAFLEDFYTRQGRGLSFPFLCTYRIARKLYPNVPSRNIRGILGYLGFPFRDIKRAESHVRATMEVWSALAQELDSLGIKDLAALNAWLEEKPKAKKDKAPVKYEYRVDRLKRLELPPRPGVYRMLSKSGDILYVGKATSLKDRVNSYFRGKKGRDPKKLELMAQVWDLQVTECGSPLEAALL